MSDRNEFVMGTLVGVVVGALVTFLFTTSQGKEIREELADKYEEIKEYINPSEKKRRTH